jgi:hypothetical protein
MQSVFIKGRFPGLNEMISAMNNNRHKGNRLKQQWTDFVAYSVLHLNPVESADFIFTWYEENKKRDPDNITGYGCKVIFDGLITGKVLKNDGWKQVKSITHKFEIGDPGVLIEIMEG